MRQNSNPTTARALKIGMSGDRIPIVLPNGKRVTATAASEILSPNVVAFWSNAGWLVYGTTKREPANQYNYRNRKARNNPVNPSDLQVNLNWLIRTTTKGKIACAYGDDYYGGIQDNTYTKGCANGTAPEDPPKFTNPNPPPPPVTTDRRFCAYFKRGFLSTVPAPNYAHGFPYQSNLSDTGYNEPANRFHPKPVTAGFTIEGENMYPIMPTPTGQDANRTLLGAYDGISIIGPEKTFIHKGAVNASKYTTPSVVSDPATSHLFDSSNERVELGIGPEFLYPTGQTIIQPWGEEMLYAWAGFPLDWWFEVEFTLLQIGSDVFVLGEDVYIETENEAGINLYTTDEGEPAAIIGRMYDAVLDGTTPTPPGAGFQLLWDGSIVSAPEEPWSPPTFVDTGKIHTYYEIVGDSPKPVKLLEVNQQDRQEAYYSASAAGSIFLLKIAYEQVDPEQESAYKDILSSVYIDPFPYNTHKIYKKTPSLATTYTNGSTIPEDPFFWLAKLAHDWDMQAARVNQIGFISGIIEDPATNVFGGYSLKTANVQDDTYISALPFDLIAFENGTAVTDANGSYVPIREYILNNEYNITIPAFYISPYEPMPGEIPPSLNNYFKWFNAIETKTTNININIKSAIQSLGLGVDDLVEVIAVSPVVISF